MSTNYKNNNGDTTSRDNDSGGTSIRRPYSDSLDNASNVQRDWLGRPVSATVFGQGDFVKDAWGNWVPKK